MKARSFDRYFIETAEEQGEHLRTAERVREIIREAFKDVKFGNGVGLKEAQAVDKYKDTVKQAAYRAKDEKEDWQQIPVDKLNYCNSSLSFFDPEGMRFHLPAYLIADLNGDYHFGVDYTLTHSYSNFKKLSAKQYSTVRAYLILIINEEATRSSEKRILRALREYWTEQSEYL